MARRQVPKKKKKATRALRARHSTTRQQVRTEGTGVDRRMGLSVEMRAVSSTVVTLLLKDGVMLSAMGQEDKDIAVGYEEREWDWSSQWKGML